MNILFITQKMDMEDDILGVYHAWAKKLASKLEKIKVICLYKGEVDLPSNVEVFSLGKERGSSRIKYLFNFYKYIFKLNREYDLIFVHMNPAYILLGAIFWKLWNKKVVYWNASYKITPMIKIGLLLADKGLTSVSEAFEVNSAKITALGQGIDTDLFRPDPKITKIPRSILFLGRISPVKNVDVIINAARILFQRDADFTLDIVGLPVGRDVAYFQEIKKMAEDLEKNGMIRFLGRVPNYQAPNFYNSHSVFVNLTENKSFDKSILEAMACESSIMVSNLVYRRILPAPLNEQLMFREKDPLDLANKIEALFFLSENQARQAGRILREIVVKDHSLDRWATKLTGSFKQLTQ